MQEKNGVAEIRVVCYYTNWSVYRPGTAKFSPQNINPYLCTHLIYAFGGFTKENTFKPFDKYQDIEKGGYSKFTGLKSYNKDLKTMIAVGGWNEGSSRFSAMVASPEKRHEFVKNSVKFLRQNHFDGLDLDWEYPSFRDGGKPRDKENYASLVQELREEFDRESEKTGRSRLLLTMAVPAGTEYINKGYDVPKLMKYLDWMNILSYDYHSAFEPSLNHHSPLYSLEEASEYNYDSDLNINHTIHQYLEAGAERDKLVLGIPTYGRSYTLFNSEASNIGDAADGPGEMGEATRENGYLSYYEICERIKTDDKWTVSQPNPNAMGPYAYKDNQWVGYDDEAIARKKSEYVAENRLGGIMFWSIDNDDFRGTCHGRPYPLIEAAKEALIQATGSIIDNTIPAKEEKPRFRNRGRKPSDSKPEDTEVTKPRKRIRTQEETSENKRARTKATISDEPEQTEAPKRRLKPQANRRGSTTSAPTTTSKIPTITKYQTPEPPTTPDPGGDFKCEDEGFYAHPRDCKKYFWCLSGPSESGIVAHQFTCPSGLHFNKLADSCDYTQNVLCQKKPKATTSTTTTTTPSTTIYTSTTFSTTHRTSPRTSTTTARTTPIPYEDEYVEYEDDDIENVKNSEEDPKVIKELIDLIKKAGGIEELERQIKLNENGAQVTAPGSTTPSALSKTLYQRILSNRAKLGSTDKPSLRNSRGPQFETQSETAPETSVSSKRGRPQYTAISRQRPKTEEPEPEEPKENREYNVPGDSKPTKPEYKSITRSRLSTAGSETDIISSTTSTRLHNNVEEDVSRQTHIEYVTLRRSRPTTTEPPSTQPILPEHSFSSSTEGLTTNKPVTVANELFSYSLDRSTAEPFSTTPIELKNEVELTTQTSSSPTTSSIPKVSELVSPRNPLRPRFGTVNNARGTNRFTTLNTVTIQRPNTITERSDDSYKRGGGRFIPNDIPEQTNNDDKYDRRFRPDIVAEISDLSSLTSADFSNNVRVSNSRRSPARRLTTTTEEVLPEEELKTSSRTLPPSRGVFNRNRRVTTVVDNQSTSTTLQPTSRVSFRPRLTVLQRKRPDTDVTTTEKPTSSSRPMRKVIRRLRVTTTTTSTAPNDILPETSDDVSLEEDENIKLSESEIRLNSLRSDKVKDEPFGKGSYLADNDAAFTEPNQAHHTRKIIRKLITTTSTEPSTAQTARTRKIIRRLLPTTKDFPDELDIPISQRKRKIQNRNLNLVTTPIIRSTTTTTQEPGTVEVASDKQDVEYTTPQVQITSENLGEFEQTTINNDEITVSSSTTTKSSTDAGTTASLASHRPPTDLNRTDPANTLAIFASIALETSDENTSTEVPTSTESPTIQSSTINITSNAFPTTVGLTTTVRDFNTVFTETSSTTAQPIDTTPTTLTLITNSTSLEPVSKSTPPFHSRNKLSRPPFLRQQTRSTPQSTTQSILNKRRFTTKSPETNDNEVSTEEAILENRFSDNESERSTRPRYRGFTPTTVSTSEQTSPKRNNRRYGGLRRTTPAPLNTLQDEAKNSRNKLFKNRIRKVNTPVQETPSSTTSVTVFPTTTTVDETTNTEILQHVFAETTPPPTTTSTVRPGPKDKKVERLIEVNRIVEVSLEENKIQKHHPTVHNEFTLIPSLDRIGAINRITEIKIVDHEGESVLPLEDNTLLEQYKPSTDFTVKPTVNVETSTISLQALFSKNADELLETQNANFVNVRILKQDTDTDTSKRYRLNEDSPVLPIRLLKPDDSGSKARVVEISPRFEGSMIKIAPISFSLTQTKIKTP